jgi:4-hydroxy-tetrahydrodipicolinate synthase
MERTHGFERLASVIGNKSNNIMNLPLRGALAALVTPIDDLGRPDLDAFDQVIDFIAERGMDGVVIGGATGEYAHFDIDDRLQMAAHAVKRFDGRLKVLTSVGTSSIHSTLELAGEAAQQGSDALLLPMPYFFRYEQEDLSAFCEHVCGSVHAPFLLYNLPGFTNPLEVDTAVELLNTLPNLIGMKDSSGQKSHLAPLADAKRAHDFSLFVGDDSLLLSAAQAGWDGVISGIACFAPELIKAVYQSHHEGRAQEAARLQAMLDEIIDWVVPLPIPWVVRVGLEARGIPNGPMHLPLSPRRATQMSDFREWFCRWTHGHGLPLDGIWSFGPVV